MALCCVTYVKLDRAVVDSVRLGRAGAEAHAQAEANAGQEGNEASVLSQITEGAVLVHMDP